ncbi:MAG TPA: PD-(D/E)XK nuclease family protein [Vicinamibacterales bacterium]|nr:PD-(D/E)XK nuclease family protein [Vicinamibacterales bacterium]
MIRVVESASNELRLAEARAFIRSELRNGDLLLVAASRGAADDLARSIAIESGATLGLHRFSLTQLAARLAAPILAADRRSPATNLGSEAVAARAAFESVRNHALTYFGPVAGTPGFPRALARTLQELRLAHVSSADLAALPLGGADLAGLLDQFEREFDSASATDRATLFASATSVVADRRSTTSLLAIPLVLLDVPLESAAEFDFVRALIGAAPRTVLTVPFGDLQALDRLASIGFEPEVLEQKGETDLVALRRYLFASRRPPERTPKGDVRLFSAPGEGRECVEIARRILEEARAGVAFDEVAVFVRSPQRYASLLEHAFKRAGIPAWFDRGTSRPHPAGRAFLAILACACEKLSARRFAEYLSLAQVPQLTGDRVEFEFIVPDDEALSVVADAASRVDGSTFQRDLSAAGESGSANRSRRDADVTEAVVAGSLRAPWKWETLIVESAVIGGDPGRWHRRLDGLAREYRLMIQEELSDDPESPRALRLERELTNLGHLRGFALPIIDLLASWPSSGTWKEWLDRFSDLAPKILRQPERVLRVIAELRPMSEIGPVSLEEARDVIAERLLALDVDPPRHRYGRVFVGSPQQARGRTFRVVFVAGLAERMFPQKPHEDPMLLDNEMRAPLQAGLAIQETRGRMERLLLRLAVGAPTERLWLSYPRIDIAESRPRVPSFYALDVMRAITGSIPRHEDLQERAVSEGGAMLAWPSPQEPARAIDDLEHDLAVLRMLLLVENRKSVRGQAHYLLRLNDALKRSVTTRWSRARASWTPFDGITRLTGMTTALVASQRLSARPYSLSALQKFSTCPYQFLLSAIYRLEPAQEPEPLQKLDPLTRGALFHQVQAEFFRTLQSDGLLPVSAGRLHDVLACLDRIVSKTAAEYHEQLAPAIERVWRDEVNDIARDLRVWARRLPSAQDWIPEYFEFSFGLSDEGRDRRSVPDPVRLDGRFLLRGSVDLIERRGDGRALRVTDHKTGKNRTTWKTVIGGGAMLQPVLYSVAVTQALNTAVTSGRLFYCTAAGGFTDHEIPINDANRRAGLEALEIVDRAIELGFLPVAPAERACTWCDFRSVCGPHEEQRVRMKSADKLGDLLALRQMP